MEELTEKSICDEFRILYYNIYCLVLRKIFHVLSKKGSKQDDITRGSSSLP